MTLQDKTYYITAKQVLELIKEGKTQLNNYPFNDVMLEVE